MGKAAHGTARELAVLMHTQQHRRLLVIAARMGEATDGTAQQLGGAHAYMMAL